MPLFLWPSSLSATCQLSWVWRYVRGAPVEVPSDEPGVLASTCINFLSTNVYRHCRDSNGLLPIIGEADPDVILAA